MSDKKNPADMTLKTLQAYFYDVSSLATPNWVFPIDNSEFLGRRTLVTMALAERQRA